MNEITSPILQYLHTLIDELKDIDEGKVADYIPELGLADKSWFGIAVATVDGKIYAAGDIDKEFTIQSISKAFTYALALEDNGVEQVSSKIEIEPSGDVFNAISLDASGRPSNPMINAGAIATVGMLSGSDDTVYEKIRGKYSEFAGRQLKLDEKVYQSESDTGHRNRAIGYMLRNFNIIQRNPQPVLENYFKQCSILINCQDLAIMGATLANNGVNPVTKKRVVQGDYIKYVLSVMSTCGMYDYSGNWLYQIGLPAKSGVGGGILAVLPGELSIAVFSPPLDERGNSSKGIKVLERMSRYFNLHVFNVNPLQSKSFIRATLDLTTLSSSKQRNEEEKKVIRKHGKEALVYILQGSLAFSGYELITRNIIEASEGKQYVLLDLNRVLDVDHNSFGLFWQLFSLLKKQNIHLLFSSEDKSSGMSQYFSQHGVTPFFDTLERGLEWIEDALIGQHTKQSNEEPTYELKDFSVCRSLQDVEFQYLDNILQPVGFKKGEHIISAGDEADSMFFLTRGTVDVSLTIEGKDRRVASFGAGNIFGEMAIVERSLRSANIIVSSETVTCLQLRLADFEAMLKNMPNLQLVLLKNIVTQLSEKLRNANKQIQMLL